MRHWMFAACLLTLMLGSDPAAQSGAVPPKPSPRIVWLIFVDDLHVDFRNTGRIRDFLHSISTTLLRDDEVIVMRTSGPSSITLDATSDRDAIAATIRKVSGAGLKVSEVSNDAAGEIDARLAMTFAAASSLVEAGAEWRDRRRVMLYISNGYDTEHGRALASLFSRAALQTQVTVFAVNAGALTDRPMVDSRVDADLWNKVLASRRQTLRAIAEPTGGIAFLDDVDVGAATSRVRAAVRR